MPLSRQDLSDDPFVQFGRWFAEAEQDDRVVFHEAVCVSTLGPDQTPEGRIVLLKGFDDRGFVFYTNLESNKGRALDAHPKAGFTFYWQPLGRQVRVRGTVSQVTEDEADAYFASRPRGSQVGAWASDQSRPLESREFLEEQVRAVEERFEGGPVPRPPNWSGFRIAPTYIEFWQEGEFRLHDRFAYRPSGETWTITRLNP